MEASLNPDFLQALHALLPDQPTPFYAYDWTRVVAQVARMRRAFPFARLFYALKANPRLGLLRRLRSLGLGAEAVSLGEVLRAYRAGFGPEEVVWNGPVKPVEALLALRERPPVVVLDSEGDLLRVARHLPKAQLLLRVNPDLPVHTHSHLATGRGESQFGVLPEAVPGLVRALRERGLGFLGLHLHLGSALERVEDFLQGYRVLERLLPQVGPVAVLDLGGGFGLGLDLKALSHPMQALARLYGAQVWLEPGRFLLAEAGVLVVRVVGTKETRRRYLLLDGGMTTLLRPALYGARHPVLPLYASQAEGEFDLAGPACEAGDVLARGVRLPIPQEGDALAILQAGAYGGSMALTYLDTPRPKELLWTGEGWEVLREGDLLENLWDGES
ncbi:diaminopimelate decarboxylase [Meiothermus sp. QL-1]|uniref:diaminopimelate decarboxylase family protein n=1 Tax=Meiothermus sp. QL-1 TaxID=2058095 RepID=UPI000E0B673D|nr:diaminopimelate decarboxylase [Meiothermus sp. QL-1]RDI95004.1 diaminopimelate decarboxylase [Meiothermus sp. QL-1]